MLVGKTRYLSQFTNLPCDAYHNTKFRAIWKLQATKTIIQVLNCPIFQRVFIHYFLKFSAFYYIYAIVQPCYLQSRAKIIETMDKQYKGILSGPIFFQHCIIIIIKTLFTDKATVQLVSNLVLLSSRNILHHMITILMYVVMWCIHYITWLQYSCTWLQYSCTYFRYVGYIQSQMVTNTQHTQIHHNHTQH
jgi:hypothetical protein